MPTRISQDKLLNVAGAIYNHFMENLDDTRFLLMPHQVLGPGRDHSESETIVKEIKKHVPTIKSVKYTKSLVEKMDCFEVIITNREKFEKQILHFIQSSDERKRLIVRDPDGSLWFNAMYPMVPNNPDTDYWKFFTCLFDIAMKGTVDEHHRFLAPYKNLEKALIKTGVIFLYDEQKKKRQKIRNIIKDQFNRSPHLFGLPQAMFRNRALLKVLKDKGVLLYNPLL